MSKKTLYAGLVIAFLLGLYAGNLGTTLLGGAGAKNEPGVSSELTAEQGRLEALVAREPGNAQAWAELGNLYYDTHRHEESVRAYARSLALVPAQPGVIVDMGVQQLALRRYDEAVASFDRALRVDPRFEPALLNKGVALLEAGRKDEAKAAWMALLRINPKATMPDGTALNAKVGAL